MTLQIEKSIVLVGLMGAGKSTVGFRLAEKLGLDFVDIDHYIEEQEGCTISEIFAENGEEHFRNIERESIKKVMAEGVKVIATGGGAFMNKETREFIKKNGTSIWLRAGIEMLLERVSRNDDRPLLQGGDKKEILENLMEERNPTYAEADLVIDSDQGPHYKVVEQIIWKL